VEQEAPKRAGIYGPVVAFAEPGPNTMQLILQSDQAAETIRVPVTVYPDRHAAEHAAEAAEEAEPEGSITFLKEQAWKIGTVHEPVRKRRLTERLRVPGEIVPAAGAKAVVTPHIAGHAVPPAGGTFPRIGEDVYGGQLMASIEAPLTGPLGAEMIA